MLGANRPGGLQKSGRPSVNPRMCCQGMNMPLFPHPSLTEREERILPRRAGSLVRIDFGPPWLGMGVFRASGL